MTNGFCLLAGCLIRGGKTRKALLLIMLVLPFITAPGQTIEINKPTAGVAADAGAASACGGGGAYAVWDIPQMYDVPYAADTSTFGVLWDNYAQGSSVRVFSWATTSNTYSALTLKAVVQCMVTTTGTCKLQYSTNSGSSWTTLFDSSGNDGGLYSAALSPSQSLASLQVRACVFDSSGWDGVELDIYDVRTEGTFSGFTGPSVSGISPTSGTIGTSVTINGSHFGATQGTSMVTFNGISATPTGWTDTNIVSSSTHW